MLRSGGKSLVRKVVKPIITMMIYLRIFCLLDDRMLHMAWLVTLLGTTSGSTRNLILGIEMVNKKVIFKNPSNFFYLRGKFGVVTKCQDKITNIEYAAKFIKCRPTDRKNVLNEIDIMNSLNHKRLINLVAAFEASRQIVLVLELVTGGELFEKLTEEEYISEKDVTFYMKQVLQGVQHMHEREILHLDLKPENIMLVNPHSTQIKLIDFGLARRYKKGDSLKVLFGTPEFMGPEVINYDQVTTATDMWSIGKLRMI